MPARPPAQLNPERVRARVLNYLQRWAAPRAELRRRWVRRIQDSVKAHGGDVEAMVAALDAVLDSAERYALVGDVAFAESRLRRGLARGASPRAVKGRLQARGISSADLDTAMATLNPRGDADLIAAQALVRRRRLGPMRPVEARKEHLARDLACLARAGFSYAIAKQALAEPELPDED